MANRPRALAALARHHQVGFVIAPTAKARPVTLLRDEREVEFDVATPLHALSPSTARKS
jgi:hypothetical protein